MFYVKESVGNHMKVLVDITKMNVFCRCPICGTEIPVDLEEILNDGNALEDTLIVCDECAKEIMEGKHGELEA